MKSAEKLLGLIQRATAFRSVPQDHVYAFLRRASDSSNDMAIDGSVVAENFDYIVPAGTDFNTLKLARLNFVMTDGAIRWSEFGGLGSALTNGVLIQVLDDQDVVQQDFDTTVSPILANEDFGSIAGVDVNITTPAAGNEVLLVRFSIFKSGNHMTLFPNWRVRVVIQDNLTGLVKLRAQLQAVLRRKRAAQVS